MLRLNRLIFPFLISDIRASVTPSCSAAYRITYLTTIGDAVQILVSPPGAMLLGAMLTFLRVPSVTARVLTR